MAINVYQERRTAREKLEALEKLYSELQAAWGTARDSSERYDISLKAAQVFWPERFAYRISYWFSDPEVGEALRVVVVNVKAAAKWHEDWCWQEASLAEKQAINQTAEEYRISRR